MNGQDDVPIGVNVDCSVIEEPELFREGHSGALICRDHGEEQI